MDNISRKYANFKSGNNFSMKNVMPEKLFGGGTPIFGGKHFSDLRSFKKTDNLSPEEAQNIVGGNHLARNTFQSPLDKIASRQSQSPFTIAQNNLIQRAKKQFNSGLQSNQNSRQEPKQGLATDNPFINHANTFNELSKHVKPLPYENEMSEGAKKFQENYKYNDIQNYLKHQGLAAISNPRGTIAENSAVGLKNFAESSEHGKNRQLNAEEKAMNVYSKINDSRQKTQELLADYGLKREDLEAKKELNKAQIGHYGASNAHMAAQNRYYDIQGQGLQHEMVHGKKNIPTWAEAYKIAKGANFWGEPTTAEVQKVIDNAKQSQISQPQSKSEPNLQFKADPRALAEAKRRGLV